MDIVLLPFCISTLVGILVFVVARLLFTKQIFWQHSFVRLKHLLAPVRRLVLRPQRMYSMTKHKQRIKKDLVYIMDIFRLHVSAGQNVETAFRSVAKSVRGVWREEFARSIRTLDMGVRFEEALEELAERLDLPELRRTLFALRQARELGVSLGGTLSVQTALIRSERKQAAEETARTAAVKIALPLVLCIFPALLIIYLAPAVLRLLTSL